MATPGELPPMAKEGPGARREETEQQAGNTAVLQPGVTSAVAREPPRVRGAGPVSPELIAILMRRGREMLQAGDISAARSFYERAAETGNAEAATAMGKTFDPIFLNEIAARGVLANPERAADWYHRAIAAGDREAGIRLKRLKGGMVE
jgi:hypothetical protein